MSKYIIESSIKFGIFALSMPFVTWGVYTLVKKKKENVKLHHPEIVFPTILLAGVLVHVISKVVKTILFS